MNFQPDIIRAQPASLLVIAMLMACETPGPDPLIIAHRAQGVEGTGENEIGDTVRALREDFGVEIDIRGDGEDRYELGHNLPEGRTLNDALDAVQRAWDDDFESLPFIIDIANDKDDVVSDTLSKWLIKRVEGNVLEKLDFIVQSSNEESLARMRTSWKDADTDVEIRFGMTLWTVVEYTTPRWLDFVVTNVSELPSWRHPTPLILFGVASRSSYERVENSQSEIFAVLTDHPRRIREFQDPPGLLDDE